MRRLREHYGDTSISVSLPYEEWVMMLSCVEIATRITDLGEARVVGKKAEAQIVKSLNFKVAKSGMKIVKEK